MNTTRHIGQDDMALFAMQLLSPNEMASAKAHIEHCLECQREVAAIRADSALYAQTVDLHTPSAPSRDRLLKQVAREKKVIPIAPYESPGNQQLGTTGAAEASSFAKSSHFNEDDEPRRRAAARVFPWLGWAVAAGVAVSAGNFYHGREILRSTVTSQSLQMAHLTAQATAAREIMDAMTDPTAMRVTLNRAQTAPVPQARAIYLANKGDLIFLASNMEPLQPSKTYELWLIPADGHDPIPAGTFKPDEHGNASVIMPPLPKGIQAKAFGVTIEDQGGSQVPTLPIVMVGT